MKYYAYIEGLLRGSRNPIEASKRMINRIQSLVGIVDVFGDKRRPLTAMSSLGALIFCGSFVYVGPFSQFVYLVQVAPDKIETMKALNCLSSTCVPLSKYIFMWTSRQRLKTIFENLHEGMSSLKEGSVARQTFTKTLRKAEMITWLVILNQFLTHFIYLLLPLVFTVFGNDRYLPVTPGDTYGLSPKYETPNYETTFGLTITAAMFSAINQTGYIILFVTILTHELGHFYAISETLRELGDVLNDKQTTTEYKENFLRDTLTFCINHHKFLLKCHAMIKQLYIAIFGAHFVMMTIVLVTTLQTLNAWDLRNTILTGVTGIMPLVIYCFGGELLISAESGMSASLYSCGWELMTPRQARAVLLTLRICQRPLHLTAAGIFIMNRETFGDVSQLVYKVYTVFN